MVTGKTDILAQRDSLDFRQQPTYGRRVHDPGATLKSNCLRRGKHIVVTILGDPSIGVLLLGGLDRRKVD